MSFKFSGLWRWDGTIGRGPFACIGIVGFAIKHNLDRLVATLVFHRKWELFNYWIPPTTAARITSLPRADALFLATMLLMALPFIRVGVSLTLRRLRAIGLPTWLTAVFFMPVINLLFFLLLSVLPSRAEPTPLPRTAGGQWRSVFDRLIPDHPLGSAALAVLVTGLLGVAGTALGTSVFYRYGWGLFVALPFSLGLASALLYGYHRPRSYLSCLVVSCLSVLLLGLLLVSLAFEGIICLLMALPIAIWLAIFGASVGYLIQRVPRTVRQAPATMLVLVLFVPGMMKAERASSPEAPLLVLSTAMEMEAPPEVVWRQVVSFSEIDEPAEWLFRLGIAYPTYATIEEHGAGAVRRCFFSTGAFVEPIEVWDEPRRLEFSVTANPPPMQEWTPYAAVHPPHLEGFLLSRQGQFLLTRLPGNRTLLEGTTWYQHNMWPAGYWQLWSDFIIHRIHLRVLRHIKRLAEQEHASVAER